MSNQKTLISQNPWAERSAQNLVDLLIEQSRRITQAQISFLNSRREGLEQITGLISKLSAPIISGTNSVIHLKNKPIFHLADLEEFAIGSVEKVFGPLYAIFNQRRTPRIPNGDLMLFHRVMKIEGAPHHFDQPASIETEYDVPTNAWYLGQNTYPYLPFAILQEMALQPCGFLSAWLGTSLLQADQDLYFRNLDGEGVMLWEPDPRGQTIRAQAEINSTTTGGGTIIQKFIYSLSIMGRTFFKGESVFGYFQAGSMANQIGLDRGNNHAPTTKHPPISPLSAYQNSEKPDYRLPTGKLFQLKGADIRVQATPQSGGELLISKPINPVDWFFSCHFYQDPVMPGSLGVEAIYQALQAYAIHNRLGDNFKSPRFSLILDKPVSWKYRGQIIPATKQMTIKVTLQPVIKEAGEITVLGDASVWADQVRIYHVLNAGLKIIETSR